MSVAGIKKIVREIHSDANGQLSWGRTASSMVLVSAIFWISYVLFRVHTLPPLEGITALIVAPYGANKISGAVQSFSQNPVIPPQPPVLPRQ